MIRLTFVTALVLALVSLFMHWVVFEPTLVDWKECRIENRELVVTVGNRGDDWQRYMLRAKIYADETLMTSTAPRKMPKQGAGETREIKLALDRELPADRDYRVELYLQRGKEPVVSHVFRVKPGTSGPTLQKAAVDGEIFPEIRALRARPVVIDVARAMGLRRAYPPGTPFPGRRKTGAVQTAKASAGIGDENPRRFPLDKRLVKAPAEPSGA